MNLMNHPIHRRVLRTVFNPVAGLVALAAGLMAVTPAVQAAAAVCAQVKIEIKQKLTFERQGFDAHMQITNGVTMPLDNVAVNVTFQDESGQSYVATSNSSDTSAAFYMRISGMTGVGDVSGAGTIAGGAVADINWLIIPSPGAAKDAPLGKVYLVGAKLTYRLNGEDKEVVVSPDTVTVKPTPLLTLDYFLPRDVFADEPLTTPIEPIEPFTLGVRVKNDGYAAAKNLKIESAQPKITENKQGLLIGFKLLDSYINDQPTENTLLLNFGDIPAKTSRAGRWDMSVTLSGIFKEFTASFTHADDLGGQLTSLIQGLNTHRLVKDVKVDLLGRDTVKDYLAWEHFTDGDPQISGGRLMVYESEGLDTPVTDQSANATFDAATGQFSLPATSGPVYVKVTDPFNGTKEIRSITRADGKLISSENLWFSKKRIVENGNVRFDYFINLFDVNGGGLYAVAVGNPAGGNRAPTLAFIPDRTRHEGEQLSFIVEAGDPDGTIPTLSATGLPNGARFTDQGGGRGIFDWTPALGQKGSYLVSFSASDGTLSATQGATLTVETAVPVAPDVPLILSPAVNSEVANLRPDLVVAQSTNVADTTTNYEFELYADAALTNQLKTASLEKTPGDGTRWVLDVPLLDNTRYYWRVRSSNGKGAFSAWVYGQFFVNLANDPPGVFNISAPLNGGEISTTTPVLSVNNAVDPEGEAISYIFRLYEDAALTKLLAASTAVAADASGTTSWAVPTPLANHKRYYWQAMASDTHGAGTQSAMASFQIYTGNTAPTAPTALSPMGNAVVSTPSVDLLVGNATDADGDTLGYLFEIDSVNTFDSPAKLTSSPIAAGTGNTFWSVTNLQENIRYYWRARAYDNRAYSAWSATGQLFMNAVNDPPPAPTAANPSDGEWIATRAPKLEVAGVIDPEGEAVSYRYQIYLDVALTQLVAESLEGDGWDTDGYLKLQEDTRYYWRVRAEDASGAVSAWSPASSFVVNEQDDPPRITLLAPASLITPTNGNVTIRWDDIDGDSNADIALYYATDANGTNAKLIVSGIKEDADGAADSHVWNTSALTPGAYYIYAVIHDAKTTVRAFAPGQVVIPNPATSAHVKVTARGTMTSEAGNATYISVVLDRAPLSDVKIGVSTSNANEGLVGLPNTLNPAPIGLVTHSAGLGLTFTTTNWNIPQTVEMSGVDDCKADGNTAYQAIVAKAISADPNFMGVKGADVSLTNQDDDVATNQPGLAMCGMRRYYPWASVRWVPPVIPADIMNSWYEFSYRPKLNNNGLTNIAGAKAVATTSLAYVVMLKNTLSYGAVATGATVPSQDVITVRIKLRDFGRWMTDIRKPTPWMQFNVVPF